MMEQPQLTKEDYKKGIILIHCYNCGRPCKFKPLKSYRNQRFISGGRGRFQQKLYECMACGKQTWF